MQSFFQERSKTTDKFSIERDLPLTTEDQDFRNRFNKYRYNITKLKTLFGNKPKSDRKDSTSLKLVNFLKTVPNIEILFRLAEHYEDINDLCKHPSMEDDWDKAWSMMGAQSAGKKYQRRPQLGISSLDLVKGMFYYKQANIEKLGGNSSAGFALLERATQYKCLEAACTLTRLNYEKLENNNELTPSQLKEMVTVIEAFIIPHGTPAFLLLASICFFISQYYQKRNDSKSAENSLQCALEYLYAAGFCFCVEASKVATHNAYNGNDIAETIGGLSININKLFEEANKICEEYNMNPYINLIRSRGREIAGKFTAWAEEISSAKTVEVVEADECRLSNTSP